MFYLKNKDTGKDLSNYYTDLTWSGSLEQAGRKLEFTLVENHKDKVFINPVVNLGDTIVLTETDTSGSKTLFTGRVFMHSRNSESYTAQYVAYDALIYLAKNKINKKFANITALVAIQQVCNELGYQVETTAAGLDTTVNYIADGQTATEAIKKALDLATAATGRRYHCVYINNKVRIVEGSETIEQYSITDKTNLKTCSHSESIEDSINRVLIVDKDGNQVGEVATDSERQKYGTLTDVYKIDDKQDTQTAARAMLKSVTYNSSITALGNIQCISGYSVEIQEEQLRGLFNIVSDSHKISNGQHEMTLTVQFIKTVEAKK